MINIYCDVDIGEIHRPSFHQTGSMIQLFKLSKDLKIPFESLEFENKMIGEGKIVPQVIETVAKE